MGVEKKQTLDFDPVGLANEAVLEKLASSPKGLSDREAKSRLGDYGPNEPARRERHNVVFQFLAKFVNPLVIVLLVIAGFSLNFGDTISAALVSSMAVISVAISFVQEYRASRAAEALSEMVRATSTIVRNGRSREVKNREIVPGDLVDLYAGDMIPADLRLLTAKDLFLNQASLTGESLPVEKFGGPQPQAQGRRDAANIAFMGSSVVSGTGTAVVLKTGLNTEFGEVSKRLAAQRVTTAFDRGLARFTWIMIRVMLVMVAVIFAINAALKHNMIEALLFSLGVAVGLTPEMLPMVVALNLSKGAIIMSRKQVIVKRLNSIQNFGGMDVFCSDKTGTLTLNSIVLERYCDVVRQEDESVLQMAYYNSFYQTGLKNLLDKAVIKRGQKEEKPLRKVDEMPFDFARRVMSVVVELPEGGTHRIITKGAPEEVFKRCDRYEVEGDILPMEQLILSDLQAEYNKLSSEGFRVLAIAYKEITDKKETYGRDDEKDLILKGYVAFLDPPKPSSQRAVKALEKLGIAFKVLTGDNDLVTRKICGDVGMDVKDLATGEQVEKMSDEELRERVKVSNVFARLSPLQKERVIRALQANGHTVGYLGDGINDAPALKAADVGISVDTAVDIAKESADIILLKKSLMVLEDGVIEGRRTFGNIIKYIKMGASSNFGNMFSMTGASLLLPFLPMEPIQILLNNFLYDMSQLVIPTDNVDKDYTQRPRPWNVSYIQKFMMVIGPVSSVFDFITFGVMYFVYYNPALPLESQALFHTGWFLESLCTQTMVIHVIRTAGVPFEQSVASRAMLLSSLGIVLFALILPFTPAAIPFKLVVPPASFFIVLLVILGVYLALVQQVKAWFINKYGYE